MITGEWFTVNGDNVKPKKGDKNPEITEAKFDTDNIELAMKMASERFGLKEHSRSRYWGMMQGSTSKGKGMRLLLSVESEHEIRKET